MSENNSVFRSDGHKDEYLVIRKADNQVMDGAIIIFPFRDLDRLLPIVRALLPDMADDIEKVRQ